MKNIPFSAIIFTFLLLSNLSYAQATSTDYMRAAIQATNKKDYKRAIELCDAVIAMKSTESTAYFHRGYNRILLKEYDAAIAQQRTSQADVATR